MAEEKGEPYALQLLRLGLSQAQPGGAAPQLCAQVPPQPDHPARVTVPWPQCARATWWPTAGRARGRPTGDQTGQILVK